MLVRKKDWRIGILGGSDAAAIMNVSPWKTQLDVYNSVLGLTANEDKPWLKAGREAESSVLRQYESYSDAKIEAEDVKISHGKHPFLVGHLDGVTGRGTIYVEAKTTRQSVEEWKGVIPLQYKCQVAFYRALGGEGVQCVDIPVWHSFYDPKETIKKFQVYTYWKDEGFERLLIDSMVNFYANHIVKKIPPNPRTLGDIKKCYSISTPGESLMVDAKTQNALFRMETLNEEIKKREKETEELKFQVQVFMGSVERLENEAGKTLATFKSSQRTSLDEKKIKEELPEVFNKYSKTTNLRTFKIVGNK